jgi:hypothetical protein
MRDLPNYPITRTACLTPRFPRAGTSAHVVGWSTHRAVADLAIADPAIQRAARVREVPDADRRPK